MNRQHHLPRTQPSDDLPPGRRGGRKPLPLTFSALGLLLLVTACSGTNPTSAPPPPTPSPTPTLDECVQDHQTATDRASTDALTGVDVSGYDTNQDASTPVRGPGCMTTHERDFIDELAAIEADGQPASILQRIVDAYPLVGPATVQALIWTYDAFKADHTQNPKLTFFSRGRLGWIPLDKITGASLPGADVNDSAWNPSGVSLSPYTPSTILHHVGNADWNTTAGVIQTWQDKFAGYTICSHTGEDSPDYAQSSGDFLYVTGVSNLHIPVENGTPGTGVIERIAIYQRTALGYTFNAADIKVRYDRHPDDADLIGPETVYFTYAHIAPDSMMQHFKLADFQATGIDVGTEVKPGQKLGEVSDYFGLLGSGPILDLTIFVAGQHDYGAKNPVLDTTTLDPFASKYVAQLFGKKWAATPTQPRYEEDWVSAPCNKGYNVPDAP